MQSNPYVGIISSQISCGFDTFDVKVVYCSAMAAATFTKTNQIYCNSQNKTTTTTTTD